MLSQTFSDTEIILLVVAGFYLAESAIWLQNGLVAFTSVFGKRATPHREGHLFSNGSDGLLFLNPLPTTSAHLCHSLPICHSPEGIAVANERVDGAAGFVGFEELRSATSRDNQLLINDRVFAAAASPAAALRIAGLISELRGLPLAERASAIQRHLQSANDMGAITARWDEFAKTTRGLRLACLALFLQTFALGPALYYRSYSMLTLVSLLMGYLAVYLVLWIAVVWLFARAYRKLYPENLARRRKLILNACLSPGTAMRCYTQLTRNLLERYDPFGVAMALGSPEEAARYARRTLLELRYPLPMSEEIGQSSGIATQAWFRETLNQIYSRVVHEIGLEPTSLTQPPTPDHDSLTYCPRCDRQFALAEGICHDCGLPLELFQAIETMPV